MNNGTMQSRLVGATLLSMFPLFNKEIVKFHVPYVMLKRQNSEIGGFLHGETINIITGYR